MGNNTASTVCTVSNTPTFLNRGLALSIDDNAETRRSDRDHSFGDFDFGLESQGYVDGTGDEA